MLKDLGTRKKAAVALKAIQKPSAIAKIAIDEDLDTGSVESLTLQIRQAGYLAFVSSHLKTAVAALGSVKKLSCVQVGANDGKEGDPVRSLFQQYAAKALLIEPIPELISTLRENYATFRGELKIENIAIGSDGDTFELNRLHPNYWSEYIRRVGRHPTGISSFDRKMVVDKVAARLELNTSDAEATVETVHCPMMTLKSVIEKNGFQDIDMLQVDCEGYDVIAIKSLGEYRPQLINFESFNLSQEHWTEWKEWAKQNGYGYIQGRHDTIAIRGAKFHYDY